MAGRVSRLAAATGDLCGPHGNLRCRHLELVRRYIAGAPQSIDGYRVQFADPESPDCESVASYFRGHQW